MATVIGVFGSRDQAEGAIREMRNRGFDQNEISMVAKGGQGGGGRGAGGGMRGEGSAVEGTVTGGAIGG
ncbi:MAG TPA: hypothetical protein GX506_09910, partial [Firmicutes bacterium]|nr:hypothetical protein [Bacillota bacterium]